MGTEFVVRSKYKTLYKYNMESIETRIYYKANRQFFFRKNKARNSVCSTEGRPFQDLDKLWHFGWNISPTKVSNGFSLMW